MSGKSDSRHTLTCQHKPHLLNRKTHIFPGHTTTTLQVKTWWRHQRDKTHKWQKFVSGNAATGPPANRSGFDPFLHYTRYPVAWNLGLAFTPQGPCDKPSPRYPKYPDTFQNHRILVMWILEGRPEGPTTGPRWVSTSSIVQPCFPLEKQGSLPGPQVLPHGNTRVPCRVCLLWASLRPTQACVRASGVDPGYPWSVGCAIASRSLSKVAWFSCGS